VLLKQQQQQQQNQLRHLIVPQHQAACHAGVVRAYAVAAVTLRVITGDWAGSRAV
jgi:hypothetical protein